MIVDVAGLAGDPLRCEGLVGVARRAEKGCVLAEQGEARQRMIKRNPVFPADRIVAGCAVAAEALVMRVLRRVTADTGQRRLGSLGWQFVAGTAFHFDMRADQRKARHPVVIEIRLFPAFGIMALGAIRAVAAFMGVILFVAGKTGFGRFWNRVANAVAGGTFGRGVTAKQRKAGILVMIERHGFPANR